MSPPRLHPVNCQSCGSQTTVNSEAKRLGGFVCCPICGEEIDLDEAFNESDDDSRGTGAEAARDSTEGDA